MRVTGLADAVTHEPRRQRLTLERVDGAPDVIGATWLHGYTLALLAPNENLNGADLSAQPDALVVTQSTVRAVAPDGAVGYSVVERDYPSAMLPSPEER